MAIKINSNTVIDNNRKGTFQVTNPGQFTTAQRDALSPTSGDLIFNTNESKIEMYNGTEWESVGATGPDGALVITKPVITSPVADPLGTASPIQLSSITFVGSDFVGSDVLLQSVDVTWEVSTDAAFTSPMIDSKAVTSGNQTLQESERTNIVINNNTNYFIRVKYNGTYDGTAVSSAYSDMIEVRFKPQPTAVMANNWAPGNLNWRDDTGSRYTVSGLTGQQMTDLWNDQSFQQNKTYVTYPSNSDVNARGFYFSAYGSTNANMNFSFDLTNTQDTFFELGINVNNTAAGNASFNMNPNAVQKNGGDGATLGPDYIVIDDYFNSPSGPNIIQSQFKMRFYANITHFELVGSASSGAPSSSHVSLMWWRITDLNGNDLFPQFS